MECSRRSYKRQASLPNLSGTLGRHDLMPCLRQKASDCDWSTTRKKTRAGQDAPLNRLAAAVRTIEAEEQEVAVKAAPAVSKKVTVLTPESAEHVARLAEHFPFQGFIRKTEHRAMTLFQVRSVGKFLEESCIQWRDISEQGISSTAGKTLTMDILNLYHVNEWLIKPATRTKCCSFVELLSCEAQMPEWYLSHWWGTLVKSFTDCVQEHAQLRGLWSNANYWICAYANRQHCLEQELHRDPRQTSFFKAMELSQGVLLVLDGKSDHGGPATPFTRIWCALELHVALEYKPSMLLDVATSGHNGGVHLLTRSPTYVDTMTIPGDEEYAKATREASFPLEVLKKGLTLELERGKATKDLDRTHILNLFAGRDLDAPPLLEHETYEKVNKRLRAFFAEVSLRQAVVKGKALDLDLARTLLDDTWRDTLRLDFTCCRGKNVDDDFLNALSRGLSDNLRELSLSFAYCSHISNEGIIILARRLPSSLETLALDFTGCTKVGDAAFAALIRHRPPNLNTETSFAIFKDTNISDEFNPLWDFSLQNVQEPRLPSFPDLSPTFHRPFSDLSPKGPRLPPFTESSNETCETMGDDHQGQKGPSVLEEAPSDPTSPVTSPFSTSTTGRQRLRLRRRAISGREAEQKSDYPVSPSRQVSPSPKTTKSRNTTASSWAVDKSFLDSDDTATNSTACTSESLSRYASSSSSASLQLGSYASSSSSASWRRREGLATSILSRIDVSMDRADRVLQRFNETLAPFKRLRSTAKRFRRSGSTPSSTQFPSDPNAPSMPRGQLPPLRRGETMD